MGIPGDELEQGVEVVPTIRGHSVDGLGGEAGFKQTAPALSDGIIRTFPKRFSSR